MNQKICELCGEFCNKPRLLHRHHFKFEGLVFDTQMHLSCETGIPDICEECLTRVDEAIEGAITAPFRKASHKLPSGG